MFPRPTLADPELNEVLLTGGTMLLERFTFANPEDGDYVTAFVTAAAAAGSAYFTVTKLADSEFSLAVIDQAAFTTGTDPTINVAAYSAAYEWLRCQS